MIEHGAHVTRFALSRNRAIKSRLISNGRLPVRETERTSERGMRAIGKRERERERELGANVDVGA